MVDTKEYQPAVQEALDKENAVEQQQHVEPRQKNQKKVEGDRPGRKAKYQILYKDEARPQSSVNFQILYKDQDRRKNRLKEELRLKEKKEEEEEEEEEADSRQPKMVIKPRGPVNGFFGRDNLESFSFFSKFKKEQEAKERLLKSEKAGRSENNLSPPLEFGFKPITTTTSSTAGPLQQKEKEGEAGRQAVKTVLSFRDPR